MGKQHTGRFRLAEQLLRTVVLTLCLFMGVGLAAAAQLTVKGTVTQASDGEPLAGVSIVVKGTSQGVTTDFDGNYTITVEEGTTLVFSYVGCQTREIKATQSHMDVDLLDNAEVLDEVVVVGYGVQKKKLVTGATAQIKGEEIAKLNTTSPLQAMQGQLPGVNISSSSGQPGSGMKVTIRGLGTIGNASPLYLIDGIGGDISTLNPNDIESIDVLKDAASAAIYGAQAANGVVLITTKQGKEGRTKVTFDGYFGWQSAPRKMPMLNSREYMTIMDEQALNSGLEAWNWGAMNNVGRINEAGEMVYNDTDWVGSMFHDNAKTQSYNIGVSGGSATSTFTLSLGYINQEGIAGGPKVSNYSRYNFRINSDHKAFGGLLTVGEQASFIYKKNVGIGVGNQYNNSLRGAFGVAPLIPIYNEDGEYNCTRGGDWTPTAGNPYGAMMLLNNNHNVDATFSGNVYAQVEPIKNLRVRTVFGVVYGTSHNRDFTPIYDFSEYSYNEHTRVSQGSSNGLTMTWTNTASYDFAVKDHQFNVLIGMESSRYSGSWLNGGNRDLKEGFDTWQYAWINNGTAATTADGLSVGGAPNDDSRTVSYFGRLGWNWKEKYMINVTVRRDGSSRFAKGHRFGTFPSVSAGWNISNEEFMESTKSWLDFLKLRVSWGRVGNQNIDNYQYLAPITTSNTHYFFGEYLGPEGQYGSYDSTLAANWGAYPSRLANWDVTWETSEQTNIGLDARFLGSRLGLNFDYYIKNTKDWLVQAPILATVGAGAPYINGGSVKNTGVEFNLTWNDIIGRDFSYSVGVNGAWNKNKVGYIPTEDGLIHGATNMLYNNSGEFYRAQQDYAIGYFWGLKTAGIFQNQQEITDWIAAGNGVLQSDVKPGDVKFVDLDHNGVIDDADKTDLGNGIPKFTYGINLNFYWRNFDLGIVGTGVAGNKIVQSYRNFDDMYANYTTAILDRWTGEGTSNRVPRVTNQNINYNQFSDLFIQDGDFFRISSLTFGYNFAPLMNQKWCSQCRLYFQAQNLVTFTKYDGMDPEIGYGTSDWVSGIDVGFYPRSRTYLIGLNLAF